MSELTIRQAQEDVEEFLEEWKKKLKRVNNLDDHFYIFTHLTEETGELARDIINAEFNLSIDRRPVKPSRKEETIARIEDDLGDILFHLLELANAYSIDLTTAFKEAITNKHTKRFGA